jgi:hypothetical protein
MTNDGRFQGMLHCARCNDAAAVSLTEEAIVFQSGKALLTLPFSDLDSFSIVNYRLSILSGQDRYEVSQLGRDLNALYERLWDAYNARTLKALFVSGEPLFRAEGEYAYSDDGGQSRGIAKIHLYDNCLCLLPPCAEARRIPLCFLSEPSLEQFSISMLLDTGEAYQVMRLGNQTGRLFELINETLRTIRKNAAEAVSRLDGALRAEQAAALAGLMPDGAAVKLSELSRIAPSFVGALKAKIAESRAADTYRYFESICAPHELYAGIKTGLAWKEEGEAVWVSALKTYGEAGAAAVELALSEEGSAATYLYRFTGSNEDFFKRLNHAMEAISFHREVVSMPDSELEKPEHALYAMAVKRMGALRFLRACFSGRAIHKSPESWQRAVSQALSV